MHTTLKTDFYRQISEVSFNLMMSQGLSNLCEIAYDFLAEAFSEQQIILTVFNTSRDGFDFFDIISDSKDKPDIDILLNHEVWPQFFFSESLFRKRDLTTTPVKKIFRGLGVSADSILHFPMDYKGKPIGDILVLSDKGNELRADAENLLASITQAMAYRITEIRRFYGLGRYAKKGEAPLSDYFKRPSEEEILAMLCQNMMKLVQADFGLYMNYHEGFRFLYPKLLYQGENTHNLFDKEKPPVLLLKDFPTFEKMFGHL
jgi:hypothetical protein